MNLRASRVLGFLLAFCVSASAAAADRIWTGGFNTAWTNANNWSGNVAPGQNDRAIIPASPIGAGFPVLTGTTTINQLQVLAGATVTLNSASILNVDGGASPFIDGTGTVAGAGLLRVTGGVNNGIILGDSITVTNFAVNIGGNSTYLFAANRTFTFTGHFDFQDGNISPPTGSNFVFAGTANQSVNIDRAAVTNFSFPDLTIANTVGTVTFNAIYATKTTWALRVLNNLTVLAGATFDCQDRALLGAPGTGTLGIGSGADVTFRYRVNIQGFTSFDIDGGADDGVLTLTGIEYPSTTGSAFGGLLAGKGTIRLDFTADGTLQLAAAGTSFYNLVVETDIGVGQVNTDVVTILQPFTVLNNLYLVQGQLSIGAVIVDVFGNIDSSAPTIGQMDFNAPGTIRVRGNVDLDSISQVTSGTTGPFSSWIFNGTTPQTLQIRALTATQFFDLDTVTISNPAGVTVLDNPNADFVVNGTLTIDAGCSLTVRDVCDIDGPLVFAPGGGNVLRLENIVVADASVLGSTFTPGTGTVIYGATNIPQLVFARSNGAPIPYYNLTIDNSGTIATQEAQQLTVNGTFLINDAAANFSAAAQGMLVEQSFISNGTFTANAGTVTMTGTGAIGGTSASLVFNNLLVDGLATDVVSAARSFTTGGNFQVLQGALTTAGIAAPITLTALLGMSVGNGTGVAGSADLDLVGPVTLAVAPTRTFLVNGTDGRFTSTANASGTPTLTRSAAGTFTATVNGQVDLFGLNFSGADAAGLNLATNAISRIRNVRFTNGAAGGRHLTISSAGLDLDCPGCYFDTTTAFNVRAVDTAPADAAPLRLRFEQRTTSTAAGAIGGPGGGEALDDDDDTNGNGVIAAPETTAAHGGAIVQWVYTANVDLAGQLQGFPEPAFDWNTFAYYSTYVVARQGAGPDTIYVLDANGDVNPAYIIPPALGLTGNIQGPLFWDTEGATHVIYFGTSTGQVCKLIDTGAGFAPPPAPWNTPFTNGTLDSVTSPVISDRTNLYLGGYDGPIATRVHGVYGIQISTKTMPNAMASTTTRQINTSPSWIDTTTGRSLFFASNAVGGISNIYRLKTASWSIDAMLASLTNIVAPTYLPISALYVGESNGRMHAVQGIGTPAQFVELPGFPFSDKASAVNGGAVWDIYTGRLFFGNAAGDLYTMGAYTGAWTLNTNYFRFATAGAAAIQSQPLYEGGVLYAGNSAGKLFVLDVATGAGQAMVITWNLGTQPLGDVSRDFSTSRIYVGSASGRLHSVPQSTDPTPAFP